MQPSPAAADAAAQAQDASVESNEKFPITRIFRLSRVAADGSCTVSAMTEQDMDGQSRTRWPPLRKALGLLSLPGGDPSGQPTDEPTAEKAWMIFESPGYEGGGVSAIPLAADGMTLMIEIADWLIYSGC